MVPGKMCLSPSLASGDLQTRRSWSRVAYLCVSLPDDLAEALWRAPHSVITQGETLRKVGARSTVRLRWRNQHFVVKHYVEPTLRHALKQNIVRSRARSTWLAAQKLADAGIATPRPVACVENRCGPFRGDSYLMYPYLEGQTLRSFLGGDEESGRPLVEAIRDQLVEFWCRLRDMRVSLADSNLKNFIVGEAGRLFVIDVDKVRFHRVAFVALRHHQRAWRQFARSAHKSGGLAERLVAELRGRM